MRQKAEKAVFITQVNKEIEAREIIANFFITGFKDVLNRFNGKVYNARTINALTAEIKKHHPRGFVTGKVECFCDPYSNFNNNKYVSITIGIYTDSHNYKDKETLITKILLNEGFRVDYEKTFAEKYVNIWYDKFNEYTDEMRSAVNNYDNCLDVAKAVADAINKYKELPYRFRENISFTQAFYLNN